MCAKKRKSLAARFILVIIILNSVLFGAGFVGQASAAPGDVTRVSVAENGSQSNGYSDWPTISSDGRYIAFYSLGSNLVAGDSNGFTDAFVRDLQTGTITRVSISSNGVQSNADSHDTVISGNGRHISFISLSTNLVPQTDTVNSYDVFVHDLETGTTTAVSVSLNNELGTSSRNSYHQSISVDGRYIAFNSSRGNMVAGDTNLVSDIFVRDMQTGTMRRVSVGPNGIQSNGDSFYTNMSDDGRYITFHSSASNLVAGDTNGKIDVFVHDIQTGVTSRVSLASGGVQSQNGDSLYPAISGDGRYVAFRSLAGNLVSGDTNAKWDIFLHDRQTGITSLVSAPAGGGFANGDSQKAALSQDGRYVTYDSYASNLVSGDTNGQGDVFVRDTQLGITTRVSVDATGAQALGGEAMYPSITPNGQYITFTSFATNMVAGDTNGVADIFMYEQSVLATASTHTATPTSMVTATFTPTSTATLVPSPTATFTPTFTATAVDTPTFTPTIPFTSTSSPTPTLIPTSTHTPTFTPSATHTVTSSPTATFTSIPENTATFTPAITSTANDTATSTIEPAPTMTFTPTFTATAENTATFTPTATSTFTSSPTATNTQTATLTPTFTATAENTATFTPTATYTATATMTATVTPSQTHTATAANTATITPTSTLTATPSYSYNPLYLSLTDNQKVGGVVTADEDIVKFDGQNWSVFFDGSDVGLGSTDLFAFAILDSDSLLMAFNSTVTLNGIPVALQDVVRFDATSLGSTTAGTFSMYLDGSDVGLTTFDESIDAISLLPDGRILISTTGTPIVPGISGEDEDVLAFTPTSLGANTSGSWSPYFDGSDVGLADTQTEDVDALDVASNGNIYLSALGDFAVSGVSGADEDIFVCVPTSIGTVTACNYLSVLYFDGSTWGLAGNDVDAFHFLAP